MTSYNVLILGASYGSLLAAKLQLGGHNVTLVVRADTVAAISQNGTRVRLPVKGRKEPVELDSQRLPGALAAAEPAAISPFGYDLVVLAMQEPQYAAPNVRRLLDAIARAEVPTMSLMDMPPPYLDRIPALRGCSLRACYTEPGVWGSFEPGRVTRCSPDPQAVRLPDAKVNIVEVTLPTNFKVSRFEGDAETAMLRRMQADMEAVRYDPSDGHPLHLPVKLKVHDLIFVLLAKWAMLLTRNYRCVQHNTAVAIKDAVHSDIEASRSLYDWVCGLCQRIGASPSDLCLSSFTPPPRRR